MFQQKLSVAIALSLGLSSVPYSILNAETSEPIIVTATRTAQTADETLASVTVITREEIERYQQYTLPELINGYAGISLAVNGGLGKDMRINIRGTEGDHVLVLIDGVKFGSATTGRAALQHIPLSQIERIEIVRGPHSSLYGSEAIGGVIQIFTRKGKQGIAVSGSIGYGTYNTEEMTVGINGGNKQITYSLNTAYLASNGFDARTTKNPDNDGYRNASLSGNILLNLPQGNSVEFQYFRAEGNNEYDGFTTSATYDTDFLQETISSTLKLDLAKDWQSVIKVSQGKDKKKSYKNKVLSSVYNTTRQQIDWQNDVQLSDSQALITGVDYVIDKISGVSTASYSENKRENTALFGQYQWFGKQNDLLASIRIDDNEAFGTHTTGNISYGYNINDDLKFITSYGTAFKAPTMNELYAPASGSFEGNPNLKPEKSKNLEIGLTGKLLTGNWQTRVFQTDIKNLIVYGLPNSNIDEARIRGIEAELKQSFGHWNINTNITLIEPLNRTTDKILRRRPETATRLDINRKLAKGLLGATIINQGHRFDEDNNTTRMGGYTLVNFYSEYQIEKNMTIRAKIDNIFDKKYQTVDGYNSAERAAFISVQYNME